MHFSLNIKTIIITLLVSARLAPLFLFAPVFGSVSVPPQYRVFLILSISYLLGVMLDLEYHTGYLLMPATLLLAIINEVIIGAFIASIIMVGFATFSWAGRLLDLQMGFGVASLLDFNSKAPIPLIGSILSMMAVMSFYLSNGHHMLLRGIAFSFEAIPLASGLKALNIEYLISLAGSIFSFGFLLIAPIASILFLIDIGLAFMSRTMPQMNIFVLAVAIKVFVGIALLALTIRHMGDISARIFNTIYGSFERMAI